MLRRDRSDLIILMAVREGEEEEKEEEKMRDSQEDQEDQEDRFVGKPLQNCTVVDHAAIVREWRVSDIHTDQSLYPY